MMISLLRAGARAARTGALLATTLEHARTRPAGDPAQRAALLARTVGALCAQHGIRALVTGHLPAGPAVLVANHVSYLDPLVVAPLAPCIPIAKGEVARWPAVGAGVRALGVLFVRRADPMHRAAVLRRALRVLAGGTSILNFPEGTTTDGSRLLPFHRGIFGIARIARVPVVPVAIRYEPAALCWTGDAWFLPHYIRTAARPRSTAHVHFAPPIAPADTPSAAHLAARTRAVIAKELQVEHEPAERTDLSPSWANPLLSTARG